MSVFITQMIYLKSGAEKIFEEFETRAIPIITRYRGQLLMRVKPRKEDYLELNIERPYEIHFIQFESSEWFDMFMKDEERKSFLHLKEASVRESLLFSGHRL